MRKKSAYWKSGEIATLLTIGAMIVVGVSVFISSLITNQNKNTTTTRATGITCSDFPNIPPPDTAPNPHPNGPTPGYYWQANCSQWCDRSSACPQNVGNPDSGFVTRETSNFCYTHFGTEQVGDWRCMMMRYGTPGPTSTPPPAPTPTPTWACPTANSTCNENYRDPGTGLQCHKEGQCTCAGPGSLCCPWNEHAYCGTPPAPTATITPTTGPGAPSPTRTPTPTPTVQQNQPPPPPPPGQSYTNCNQVTSRGCVACLGAVVNGSRTCGWFGLPSAGVCLAGNGVGGASSAPQSCQGLTASNWYYTQSTAQGKNVNSCDYIDNPNACNQGGGNPPPPGGGGATGKQCSDIPDSRQPGSPLTVNNYAACTTPSDKAPGVDCGVLETVGQIMKCVPSLSDGSGPVVSYCPADKTQIYKWHWFASDIDKNGVYRPDIYVCGGQQGTANACEPTGNCVPGDTGDTSRDICGSIDNVLPLSCPNSGTKVACCKKPEGPYPRGACSYEANPNREITIPNSRCMPSTESCNGSETLYTAYGNHAIDCPLQGKCCISNTAPASVITKCTQPNSSSNNGCPSDKPYCTGYNNNQVSPDRSFYYCTADAPITNPRVLTYHVKVTQELVNYIKQSKASSFYIQMKANNKDDQDIGGIANIKKNDFPDANKVFTFDSRTLKPDISDIDVRQGIHGYLGDDTGKVIAETETENFVTGQSDYTLTLSKMKTAKTHIITGRVVAMDYPPSTQKLCPPGLDELQTQYYGAPRLGLKIKEVPGIETHTDERGNFKITVPDKDGYYNICSIYSGQNGLGGRLYEQLYVNDIPMKPYCADNVNKPDLKFQSQCITVKGDQDTSDVFLVLQPKYPDCHPASCGGANTVINYYYKPVTYGDSKRFSDIACVKEVTEAMGPHLQTGDQVPGWCDKQWRVNSFTVRVTLDTTNIQNVPFDPTSKPFIALGWKYKDDVFRKWAGTLVSWDIENNELPDATHPSRSFEPKNIVKVADVPMQHSLDPSGINDILIKGEVDLTAAFCYKDLQGRQNCFMKTMNFPSEKGADLPDRAPHAVSDTTIDIKLESRQDIDKVKKENPATTLTPIPIK